MKVDDVERGPVPEEVLAYWRSKEIAPAFDVEDAWAEEHAHAFRVAGITSVDLLAALHAVIDRALAEGWDWSPGRVADALEAIGVTPLAPHRLRLIVATNVRVARAVGQWARIERTKAALPYLLRSLGPAQEHRPLHVTWAGTVLPVDDPWWSTHFPPDGFGCKCWVRQITAAEAARIGVASAPPPGDPDPGWANNPGKERLPPE